MQNILKEDWHHQLRLFAEKHQHLRKQLEVNTSIVDEVHAINEQVKETLDQGDLHVTERLLKLALDGVSPMTIVSLIKCCE